MNGGVSQSGKQQHTRRTTQETATQVEPKHGDDERCNRYGDDDQQRQRQGGGKGDIHGLASLSRMAGICT